MCRNTSSFVAILLSLLASRGGRFGVLVQAFSTPHPLQIKHTLSQDTFGGFSQVGGSAPVDTYNGVAFVSGETGPGGTNDYEQLRQRIKKRREEHERRQKGWEKEYGIVPAAEGVPATSSRYGPSHSLQKQYAEDTMRQRGERQKLLAAQQAEEGEEAEEAVTTVVYKNTIRACLDSGQIDRQQFCEQAGSVLECAELLDTLERTNSFIHLRFDPLTYKVNARGKPFTASVPFFQDTVLQFLSQLHYSLSQPCNYDVKASQLVRSCFEDAVDSTSAGEKVWGLSRSRERSVLPLPTAALKSAFSRAGRHRMQQLYELALILTTTLVEAGSMYRTFPILSRLFNLACRLRRLCIYGIREMMKKSLHTVHGAAVDTSAGSSSQLMEKLRKTFSALFKGSRDRIAQNAAVVLSAWLEQSTKAILEAQSPTDGGEGMT